MTVAELIGELSQCPPDLPVCFDTEAARFHVHLVEVDTVSAVPDDDAIVLGSKAEREH